MAATSIKQSTSSLPSPAVGIAPSTQPQAKATQGQASQATAQSSGFPNLPSTQSKKQKTTPAVGPGSGLSNKSLFAKPNPPAVPANEAKTTSTSTSGNPSTTVPSQNSGKRQNPTPQVARLRIRLFHCPQPMLHPRLTPRRPRQPSQPYMPTVFRSPG